MRHWKEKTQPKANRRDGIVKTTLEIGDKEDRKTIEKNRFFAKVNTLTNFRLDLEKERTPK